MKRSKLLQVIIVSAAISMLLAATIFGLRTDDHTSQAAPLSASNYPRWPAETLADWVGFSDQVSVLVVTDESKLEPEPQIAETGEGLLGRRITAQVQSTIWDRPGAPRTSGPLELGVDGWVVHGDSLIPVVPAGSYRVEVGDRVIAALVRTPEGSWSFLSAGAVIPLGLASGPAADRATNLAPPMFRGKSVPEIRDLIRSSRATPLAAKYQHLDPDARARAVWEEMLSSGSG